MIFSGGNIRHVSYHTMAYRHHDGLVLRRSRYLDSNLPLVNFLVELTIDVPLKGARDLPGGGKRQQTDRATISLGRPCGSLPDRVASL